MNSDPHRGFPELNFSLTDDLTSFTSCMGTQDCNISTAHGLPGNGFVFRSAREGGGWLNGGTWNNPTTIRAPRFARFNVTFDF